jgi:hypothetical protein
MPGPLKAIYLRESDQRKQVHQIVDDSNFINPLACVHALVLRNYN